MGGSVRVAALALALSLLVPGSARAAELAAIGDGAGAAGPSLTEARTFESTALGRAMTYVLYLPPGYATTARRYPVLYMLHGMGADSGQWKALGLLDAADSMIRARAIQPLIIVMPQGDQAYWMDHAGSDQQAWGTYAARDLVAEVDSRFRTLADRSHRAIGGLSMGAHGALLLALDHPDTFGVAGAHSLVLRRLDQAPPFFGGAADYAKRDPLSIVRADPEAAARITFSVDIGDRDPWTARTEQFESELRSLAVDHEWHEWAGDHSGTYWTAHVPDYLRFYDRALDGAAPHGWRLLGGERAIAL
jgi:enterochelin esterase-like enzyme